MPAHERLRELAERLIGYLDEDGYLRVPLEEIAQESGCSLPELEEALRLVQSLDPPGIGARSLAECLEIQLRHRRVDDPLAYEIVRKYLPELQKKNIKKLAKQLGAEEERVRNLVNLITSLEPKPGYAYSTTPPAYIRPDVIVRRIDNDYYVFVDDGLLSDLRISPTYRRLLEEPNRLGNEEERKFAREKLKAAQWLVKNINRRKNTLLRVAQAIVDHQREFFDKGINYLKPLTLRQIAEEVGMHESTVARVTSGKYIDTPRGTFEMKYFFSRGLPSDSGEEASNRTVKQMIAELIENDDPNNPMSDQRIVELLKEKGINIARRTVAKYREQLGILPSRLRKKV
jgi:RNA polymerase sigma-54 factor